VWAAAASAAAPRIDVMNAQKHAMADARSRPGMQPSSARLLSQSDSRDGDATPDDIDRTDDDETLCF
jgi:hypothetical protein